MGWMLAKAQTIEHQYIQAGKCLHGLRWNLAQVGGIGKIVESISHHRKPPVNDLKRRDFELTSQTKLSARYNHVSKYLRQTTTKITRLEDVFEYSPNVDPSSFVRINAQWAETDRKSVV